MEDAAVKIEDLVVGAPRRIGASLIVPLVRENVRQSSVERGWFWIQAEQSVAAVVVKTGQAVRVLSIDGQEQDAPSLVRKLPELAATLAGRGA